MRKHLMMVWLIAAAALLLGGCMGMIEFGNPIYEFDPDAFCNEAMTE